MTINPIKIEGLNELIEEMKDLPIQLSKTALKKAVSRGTRNIAERLRTVAPRDTGYLSEHIKQLYDKKKPIEGVEQYNLAIQFYGRMIEFGTSKMPARPWIRPVFDGEADRSIEIIGQELKRFLLKAKKKYLKSKA